MTSIGRVPVVRDGRIVGIVSRADLLCPLAAERPAPAAPARSGLLAGRSPASTSSSPPPDATGPAVASSAGPDDGGLTVACFRHSVADHEREETRHRDEVGRAAAEKRRHRVTGLIDRHVFGEGWRTLLHQARRAAESGRKKLLLLRFPSQLCSDGGRAIKSTSPAGRRRCAARRRNSTGAGSGS